MAIPTTRTKVEAQITINHEKCSACGLCVSVCKSFCLKIDNKQLKKTNNSIFGCIGCGHCMAICPNDAIKINGREISPQEMINIPPKENTANYEQFLNLMYRRRSIREFQDREVDEHIIQKILEAAQTSPMGLPPSDVNVLVICGKKKVNCFAKDYSEYLKSLRFLSSKFFLAIMRPFWGKENDEIFKSFINPLFSTYIDEFKKGNNFITYDAPLAMYFYGTPYSDPADPIVAATYAMLAGESLGLGTCMLGGIHPFIIGGSKAKKFREKHQINYKSKEGLFVIFGYSKVKYQKTIKRSFASINFFK
mgnify:CR=1 FL=1